MRHGLYRIFLPCSSSTLTPLLKRQLADIYGFSGRVVDFTLIELPTQSYIVMSIGERETPTRRQYSADRLAIWFYNPSPLMRFYHFPTAGVHGWILLPTLRQILRQRILSARVTPIGFYPILPLPAQRGKRNMSVVGLVREWRGFTATIRRIHERTYYG